MLWADKLAYHPKRDLLLLAGYVASAHSVHQAKIVWLTRITVHQSAPAGKDASGSFSLRCRLTCAQLACPRIPALSCGDRRFRVSRPSPAWCHVLHSLQQETPYHFGCLRKLSGSFLHRRFTPNLHGRQRKIWGKPNEWCTAIRGFWR